MKFWSPLKRRGWGPLTGFMLAQKALQGSEIETSELQEGTEENMRWGIMELPSGPINDFSTKSQQDDILLVSRPRARRSVSWAGPWRDQPPLPGHRPTAPFCILLACGIFRGCRVRHDYGNHPLHRSWRFGWRWRLWDNGNHPHHVFFDCVDIINCWFENNKAGFF